MNIILNRLARVAPRPAFLTLNGERARAVAADGVPGPAAVASFYARPRKALTTHLIQTVRTGRAGLVQNFQPKICRCEGVC